VNQKIGGSVTESRQERKRTAILEAASEVFLRNGYVGSSMDEVAAAAAVSKQTVYKHFADKETLFRELITATVHATGDQLSADLAVVGDRPLAVELRAFARHLVHGIMQPRVLRLRRLVIGEATRFPELGRTFYQGGVARTVDTLASDFDRLAERGLLHMDDSRLAAEQFNWLVVSIPLNRAMLLGDDHGMSTDDLDKFADAGVDTFLAAYAAGAE
jgi:TetR/AcrR family transcriptional repressor of mexJK operon